jgi:hypothetical protein
MAKHNNEKPRQTLPRKDKGLQAIYDQIRREFSAADLAEYAEIEDGVPFHQTRAELGEMHRKSGAKKGGSKAARSQSKPQTRSKVMAKRKNENLKQSRPKRDKKLQAIYDRVRREFSAADLQKYTEIEPMVPIEKVLADLEKLDRQLGAKEKEKPNARSRSKRRKV